MKTYTSKELADILKVSEKTIQRDLQTFGDKNKFMARGKYLIPYDIADKIAISRNGVHLPTISEIERQKLIEQSFTEEEYNKLMTVIEEYPLLKNELKNSEKNIELYKENIATLQKQLEYFQFSYNKQLEIHEKLIDTFRERNFIEAKEKGLDN